MFLWSVHIKIGIFLILILSIIKPLGWYIAQVYTGKFKFLKPIEQSIYRICGIHKKGMNWKQYACALLLFNILSIIGTYIIQRLQYYLPLNPQALSAPRPGIALNAAISYGTNTNWQVYSGEQTMSYFTQMLAFTTQNFLSAATGLSVLMVFIRSLAANKGQELGNYWVDMVRGILYILLPFSMLLAVLLSSQGVIQNLKPNQVMTPLQTQTQGQQYIPMGPVASQIAIKQLGSNGGGFFNANSAHPFENPTLWTNLLEMLAILLIPAALIYTFGFMIKDLRQSKLLCIAMFVLFIPSVYLCIYAEQSGNPYVQTLGVKGPNMEGKETRFGITYSALWSVAATATANGSLNSSLDSYMPLGGGIPLWLMQLGEMVFGGVGSGLYSMLVMVIVTVFLGGLMVGRSPEYLGKKIEAFDIQMVSIVILLMPFLVLFCTGLAVFLPIGRAACTNSGMHGLSEILYGFTSMMTNNGSAFAGLDGQNNFYLFLGSAIMFIGRYVPIVAILALSGSLLVKPKLAASAGVLQTHSVSFLVLLMITVLIVGTLSFIPVLALGPIVEHLMIWTSYAT